jgi:hypothetical protein
MSTDKLQIIEEALNFYADSAKTYEEHSDDLDSTGGGIKAKSALEALQRLKAAEAVREEQNTRTPDNDLIEALEKHVDVIEEVLSLKDHPQKMELFEEIALRLLKVVTESKAALTKARGE